MIADLKYALRQMAKSPAFYAIAVLILALGIASNTAIFSVIDSLLLQGLPVNRPAELVVLSADVSAVPGGQMPVFSLAAFERFRAHSKSLSELTGIYSSGRSLVATGLRRSDSIAVSVSGVSGNYFPFFGVTPSLGRALAPSDDKAGAAQPVAVISDSFWRSQFGAAPNVVGQIVTIDHFPVSIVGVAPAGFTGVEIGKNVDIWIPLHLYPVLDPSMNSKFGEGAGAILNNWMVVFGRMKPGMSRASVSSELDPVFRSVMSDGGLSGKYLQGFGYRGMDVQPGGSGYTPIRAQAASLLQVLMVIVAAVLLIACANVAGLLLARASTRQREFAVRGALGAGRAVLFRQLLVESLVLAAIGGALGILLTHWELRSLVGFLPGNLHLAPRLDARILAFAAGISAATGILVGIIPALRFTRLDLISALKQQAGTHSGSAGQRINKSLVAAQIALSMCLLAGAGLFARTLQNLRNVDTGFNARQLLTVAGPFEKAATLSRRLTISRDALARLQALPGVRAATFSWGGGGLLVGNRGMIGMTFSVEGYAPAPGANKPLAYTTYVGPDFFKTMGIAVLQGRGISADDDYPAIVPRPAGYSEAAVVDESFARHYFPSGQILGRQIRIPDDTMAAATKTSQSTYRIVGVVHDTKQVNLRDENDLEIYLPVSAVSGLPPRLYFDVRTVSEPLASAPQVRAALRAADSHFSASALSSMEQAIDLSTVQEAVVAQTAGTFSLFAVILAALGLYGLLAYNVSQRTREIGVRMALGANSSSLVALILRQGLLLTAAGCLAGTAASIGMEHLIASRLYGVHAFDPLTFICTSCVLFVATFLACWLPARRATKVDPMIALRAE